MEALFIKLKFSKMDDWYRLKAEDFAQIPNGRNVLRKVGYSPSAALRLAFPSHQWDATKFSKAPNGHWSDITNQRRLLDDVGKELGVVMLADWYQVSNERLKEIAGSGIMKIYKGSLLKLLQTAYPEHKFEGWRFAVVPRNYWKERENRREFLLHLMKVLGMKGFEDWYQVKVSQLAHQGGSLLLHYFALQHEFATWSVCIGKEACKHTPGGRFFLLHLFSLLKDGLDFLYR